MGREVILVVAVAITPGLKPFPGKQRAHLCAGRPPWLRAQSRHGTGRALLHLLEGTHSCTGLSTRHRSVSLHWSGMLPEQCPAGLSWSPGGGSIPVLLAPSLQQLCRQQGGDHLVPVPRRELSSRRHAPAVPGPSQPEQQELCPLSHAQDTWPRFAAPSPWLQGHAGARGGLANAWGHAAEIKPRWHQSEAAPCIDGKDMPGHSGKAAQTQETQHNSRLLHPGTATPASNRAPSPEKAGVFQPFW